MFSLAGYQLTALFMETYFYGISSISFAFCIHSLLTTNGGRRSREDINWLMLTIGCVLYVVGSLDVFFTFIRCLKAFIFYDGPGGPDAVFSDLKNWIALGNTVLLLVQTIIGDGVLIYRCWIVYNRSWRIISASILLWIGNITAMIIVLEAQATINTAGTVAMGKQVPPNRAFWILSIVQNILTTSLIVGRIRHVDQESSRLTALDPRGRKNSELKKVMRRIIESGLLYTVTITVTFIAYACGSGALYVCAMVLKQITPISFNLIIIRASKSSPNEYTVTSAVSTLGVAMDSLASTAITSSGSTVPAQVVIGREIVGDNYNHKGKETRKSDSGSDSYQSGVV